MNPLYNINGLVFWTEREIRLRRQFEDHFAYTTEQILLETNPAWRFIQIEAPLLTPKSLLNPNYTNNDIWSQGLPPGTEDEFMDWTDNAENIKAVQDKLDPDIEYYEPGEATEYEALMNVCERGFQVSQPVFDHAFQAWARICGKGELALRPETTPGSYAYACHLLNSQSGVKPPFCIWQVGKSFRREQEQVTKNMRLKEFYQQEFQCIYTADTMNDYHQAVLEPIREMLAEMVGLPSRIVESDRLPSYSETTMDVEVDNGDKWMEICSVSRRTDFPETAKFQTKKGMVEKELLVLEVAIGLDRCVYNFQQRNN